VAGVFAQDYAEAREEFLAAAVARGQRVESALHPRKGAKGEDLAMDSVLLGAAALLARKPSLIYCNIGAFGARGPLAGRPGYGSADAGLRRHHERGRRKGPAPGARGAVHRGPGHGDVGRDRHPRGPVPPPPGW